MSRLNVLRYTVAFSPPPPQKTPLITLSITYVALDIVQWRPPQQCQCWMNQTHV